MEFVPVNDNATNEQIKQAVEFCTGIPASEVFIYIPEDWPDIGRFWGAGKRFGEWDIDGDMILVMEHKQSEEENGCI
jgi:hypothetical protein